MKDLKKIIAIALSLVCLAGCSAGGETAQESETAAESIRETETEISETVTEESITETEKETEAVTTVVKDDTITSNSDVTEESSDETEKPDIYMVDFDLTLCEASLKECEEVKSMTDDETLLNELNYLYEEIETQKDRAYFAEGHVIGDDALSDYTEAVMKVHLIKNLINGENSSAITLENGVLSYGNKKLDVSSLGEGSVSYKELADDEIWGMGEGFAYRISDANRSITITNYACETPDIVLKNVKMSYGGFVVKGLNTIEGTFNIEGVYDYGDIWDGTITDFNSDDSLFNGELKAVYYTAEEEGTHGASVYTAYYMYLSDSGLELLKIEYNDYDFREHSMEVGLQNMQELGFPEICNKIVKDFTITSADIAQENNSQFVTTVDSTGEADVPLDNTVFYEDIGIGEVVNGKAYYIYCTSDKSAEIYGVTYDSSDKAHTWLYTPYYTDTQQFENNHYIIIKHDGITEEFPCDWYDGYDTPANIEFYENDFDSDGTKEIAIKRLAMHGQGCGDELYMFKKTSEGYVLYLCRGDNALAELNNNVTIDIDNENHTVTAKWNNSDISHTADISENLNSARFDFNQTFYLKNNKLYISAELKNTDFPFTRYFKVDAELVFDGKQFSLSSPVFGEIDFD